MILYFSIENYRSIGMEQEIFFEPNTDKIHSEKLLSTENYRALPVIPIYGGNATGKTNILRALKTLQELINGDKNIKESYERCQFIQKKHTSFKVNFLKNNRNLIERIFKNNRCLSQNYKWINVAENITRNIEKVLNEKN